MLDLIRSINIEVATYLSIAMIILTVLIHGLVILKVIPYTWINGGRSKSYEAQKKQSVTSIVILMFIIPILLVGGNIITLSIGYGIFNIILWIIVLLFAVNTIMQFLGTTFERSVMSIIVIILLICVMRMALETV